MKIARILLSAVLGGIALSLGGAVYLNLYNDSLIAAAVLFGVGILAAVAFELDVFTDKVGKVIAAEAHRTDKVLTEVLVVLLGNIVGATAAGLACSTVMKELAKPICIENVNDTLLAVFVRAVFCGILMFIAFHGYKRQGGGFAGCVIAVSAAAAFVVCGFEHFVIDVFYFATMRVFGEKTFAFLAVTMFGNALGAFLFAIGYELKKSDSSSRRRHHHRHHSDSGEHEEEKEAK